MLRQSGTLKNPRFKPCAEAYQRSSAADGKLSLCIYRDNYTKKLRRIEKII